MDMREELREEMRTCRVACHWMRDMRARGRSIAESLAAQHLPNSYYTELESMARRGANQADSMWARKS